MRIRDAREDDAGAIAALHNALIPDTTVTWTETLDTPEHRAEWLRQQRETGFPVLVAESEGGVVGFTTYEHFRGEGE